MANEAPAMKSVAPRKLRGAPAIAKFLGEDIRDVYYGLEKGWIPAWKEGSMWVSSEETICEAHRLQAERAIEAVIGAASEKAA